MAAGKKTKGQELEILDSVFPKNPMQKFVELLHWEYHSGKLSRSRYYKKNSSKTLKKYKPKAGALKWVEQQISLLPPHMQKVAREVGTPKSISLTFSIFTDHTDYILYNDELRKITEIMILSGFDSESVIMAIEQQPFSRNIAVRDIERYKYFFWYMEDPHMTLMEIHQFMRAFDGDEEMSKGYTSHLDAFYHRIPMDYIMMTLGASSEDMMPSLNENTRFGVNALAVRFKTMVRDMEIPLSDLNEMANSFARMLRAYSTLERDDSVRNLVDLLTTKTVNNDEKDRKLLEAATEYAEKSIKRKLIENGKKDADDADFDEKVTGQ